MKNLAHYSKFIAALGAAVVAILTRSFGPDSTVVFDVVALVAAVGVLLAPKNTP